MGGMVHGGCLLRSCWSGVATGTGLPSKYVLAFSCPFAYSSGSTVQLSPARPPHKRPAPLLPPFLLQFPQRRPSELSNKRLSKKNKTVNRAYGGTLSHGVVRERWGQTQDRGQAGAESLLACSRVGLRVEQSLLEVL